MHFVAFKKYLKMESKIQIEALTVSCKVKRYFLEHQKLFYCVVYFSCYVALIFCYLKKIHWHVHGEIFLNAL